jgi:hypothetical protein
MRAMAIGVGLLMGILSCRQGTPGPPQNTPTQRQRDSTLGASRLPGASGVRGALNASDSAAARRAREDTAGQQP